MLPGVAKCRPGRPDVPARQAAKLTFIGYDPLGQAPVCDPETTVCRSCATSQHIHERSAVDPTPLPSPSREHLAGGRREDGTARWTRPSHARFIFVVRRAKSGLA